MPQDYVITVMSVDRVGIISDLSEAILELDGNICALSQTVVQGYFTVIVTAHFDDRLRADRISEAVRSKGASGELGVLVTQRETGAAGPVVPGAQRFILTVTGADRKGIIQRITSYLAARNINIEDLYATALEGASFLLIAQIQVPQGREIERLQMDVQELWTEADVRVSLQHENIFLATSHVDFRQPPEAGGAGESGC